MSPQATSGKPPGWRRWLGIGLRTVHIACVVLLGAAVLGAPVPGIHPAAALAVASGLALLAADLADGRVRLGEVAGAVVLLKLAVAGWMAWDARHAALLFWTLLALSAVGSHAPRGLRHWRPRR